jgi:hypothetical protein
MKKLLLLGAIPLSLSLFSFLPATNYGVTLVQPGYYDIAAQNSISAADNASINQIICNIYGLVNDPQKSYNLDMIQGQSKMSTLKLICESDNTEEFVDYVQAAPLDIAPQLQQLESILNAYIQN